MSSSSEQNFALDQPDGERLKAADDRQVAGSYTERRLFQQDSTDSRKRHPTKGGVMP
jgi:hypothetical protein